MSIDLNHSEDQALASLVAQRGVWARSSTGTPRGRGGHGVRGP